MKLLEKIFHFGKDECLTKRIDLQNNYITCCVSSMDSGLDYPGRSFLPPSEGTKNLQRGSLARTFAGSPGWFPQGRCQQKKQTLIPPTRLCLGVSTFSLCPYKSKTNISKIIFLACLSFQRKWQRVPPFQLLYLEWPGLRGLPLSSPLYAISSQAPQADILSDLPSRSSTWDTSPSLQCLSKFHALHTPSFSSWPLTSSISLKSNVCGTPVCLSIRPNQSSPSLMRVG